MQSLVEDAEAKTDAEDKNAELADELAHYKEIQEQLEEEAMLRQFDVESRLEDVTKERDELMKVVENELPEIWKSKYAEKAGYFMK